MTTGVKNRLFWVRENTALKQYPWLCKDEECEVCIVGAGITGAMAAYRFASEGIDTVVVNANQIGFGETATAVPFATYDMGLRLTELSQKVGIQKAVELLQQGVQSLDRLERFVQETGEDVGFERRDSLIYTSNLQETELLNREYLLRRHNGIDVDYISKETAVNIFSFDIEGAIISKQLAAQLDPYRLTHALLKKAVERGARVYENTEIESVENNPDESILSTSTGRYISAEHIIMAVGNEAKEFVKNCAQTKTTFAIATKPVGDFSVWPGRCIITPWSRPNITFSCTPDDNVYVSGLDTAVLDKNALLFGKIPAQKIVRGKFADLKSALCEMFPTMTDAQVEYELIGNYIQTSDSLPVVVEDSEYHNCYFAVCSGRDSILFSEMMAGAMLSKYLR